MQRKTRLAAVAALALATTAGPAVSASNSNGGSSGQNNTQALIQQYQQKSQKLQKIHNKTLKNNPQLKKEQQNYRDMVQSAIKKQGYDMQSGRQKLQKLSKKLQSGDLGKSQRKQVMQKFQSERKQMTKARQQAMNQPKIKQARQKLQKHTLAAMKKQNSKTQQLIDSLRSIQKKMRNSMKKRKSQAG